MGHATSKGRIARRLSAVWRDSEMVTRVGAHCPLAVDEELGQSQHLFA